MDRWQELESQQQPKVPQSFSQALLLAAKLQEEVEQQALQIEYQNKKISEDAPKVSFYEKFMNSDGLITIRDAARYFNVQESAFKTFLRFCGIIEKCSDRHAPVVDMRKKGFMVYKPNKVGDKLGTGYFTPLGMEYIEKRKEAFKKKYSDMYDTMFKGNEWSQNDQVTSI